MLYQSDTIEVRWIKTGIAELIFNASGPINILDTKTVDSLDKAVSTLEQLPELVGLILSSSKTAFIMGADIKEFLSLFDAPAEQLAGWLNYANSIFNRIEDLPLPTVSAINGYALGGGCECILTTDFRIASPDATIALPETKLGIMPGFGGSVRLPRLIGTDSALEMITTGKNVGADEALKLGLISAIVPVELLIPSAIKLVEQAIAGKFDWKKARQPKLEALQLSHIEQLMSFTVAKGTVMAVAGKHYPAPLAAVMSIEKAANCQRDEALKHETSSFIPLAHSSAAQALVSLFLNDQYIKSIAKKYTKDIIRPSQAAVLGAGIMGGGIAYQSANKGVPVFMKDITESALKLGLQEAEKLLSSQFERKKISAVEMARILSSIHTSVKYAGIEDADIIIEAVVENAKIKSAVLAETELFIRDDAILTSNTSTISITELARTLKRPENFCGMHFFNPVHRMPLVEIIRGKQTADKTIATVVAYAQQMGKTPIVVNDCPGFFVNRVLFPYLAGFSQLIQDGADFKQIDKVMETEFGWPMGPAYLLDVIGIDTAHHAQQVMAASYPDRLSHPEKNVIDLFFEQQRLGQKNSRGFYQYHPDKKGKPVKSIDPLSDELIANIQQSQRSFTSDEIIQRMMIPMINEVILCLEEGIIQSPAEADIALIYGLGFPPFRGGVFRYLENMGINNYLASIATYSHLGPLYQPTEGLKQKAVLNSGYYPQPAKVAIDIDKTMRG